MRFIAFIRLFKTIFNKKDYQTLPGLKNKGFFFVKIAQTFALRIDFLTPRQRFIYRNYIHKHH